MPVLEKSCSIAKRCQRVFSTRKEKKNLNIETTQKDSQPAAILDVGSKNRPTQTQILKRRKEMINYDRLGYKAAEWIPWVAAKYGASEDAVKRDWSNRGKWMEMYFQSNEVQTLGVEILYDYEIALRDACELYDKTEDLKMKPTVFGLKLKALKMKTDFLNDFRVLDRVKEQYYIELQRRKRNDPLIL